MRCFFCCLLLLATVGLNAQSTSTMSLDTAWTIALRLSQSDPDSATVLLNRVVTGTGEMEQRHFLAREQLGELARRRGAPVEALRWHRPDSALAILLFGEQSQEFALNQYYIGRSLMEQTGGISIAAPYIERAFVAYQAWLPAAPPRYLDIFNTYLVVLRNTNRSPEALVLYPELYNYAEANYGAQSAATGGALVEWGAAHAELMQVAPAIDKLEAGVAILLPQSGYADDQVTSAFFYLMNMYRAINDPEGALRYAHRTAHSFSLSDYPAHEMGRGFLLLTMGDLHLELNNYDSTNFYYQKSFRFFEKYYTPDDYPYQVAQGVLANNYFKQGEYNKALAVFDQVLAWWVANPAKVESSGAMQTVESAAIAAAHLGQYPRAIRYARTAVRYAEAYFGPVSQAVMTTRLDLAALLHRSGKHAAARAELLRAETIAGEYLYQLYPAFSAERQRSLLARFEHYDQLVQLLAYRLSDATTSRLAYDHLLKFKGFTLETERRLRQGVPTLSPALDTLLQQWKALGEALAEVPATPRSDARRSRYDSLGNVLARRTTGQLGVLEAPTWEAVRDQLGPEEAALEVTMFPVEEGSDTITRLQYVAYLLRDTSTAPVLIPLFAEAELPKMQQTKALYGNGADKLLYNRLGVPLLAQLDGVQTLYYAPGGIMHRINVGAVPTRSDGQLTLSDHLQVRLMTSTGQLTKTRSAGVQPFGQDAVILGNIDYGPPITPTDESVEPINPLRRSYAAAGWPTLSFTGKEAKAVREQLDAVGWNTRLLTRATASEAAVKSLSAAAPRVLHIATHGYFFPPMQGSDDTDFSKADHPLLRSGLILADGNRGWLDIEQPAGAEDGILTALEVSQLDLRNTELVVLSACDTGRGDIEGSEGVYGLQRAFQIAGAKHVLMSLWKVDDERTYAFMTRFYHEWQAVGHSIPEAYRRTQAAMRQRYARPFNPRAWAGFVLLEQ